jgi:hypothetical protein
MLLLVFLPIIAANTAITDYNYQVSNKLPNIDDPSSLIRCWQPFAESTREHISHVFDTTGGQFIDKRQWSANINSLCWAVGNLKLTINRITWKPDPEIGTDGPGQPWQNPQVDGYGSGFGPPGCSVSDCWMDFNLNWSVYVVSTQTTGGLLGPVANTCQEV